MKKVLLIGLLPSVVDFTGLGGLTEEKLAHSLEEQEKDLCDLGFDAKWCLIDHGETAESVARAALMAKEYDVVMIGAGVRMVPTEFTLFERLINVVHELAPKAKLCFNTNPDDTEEAVLRWTEALVPSA